MKYNNEIKPIEKNHKKNHYKHQFDFEIGSLIKSPCKTCVPESDFPTCMDTCDLLSKIHTLLKNAISCSRHRD